MYTYMYVGHMLIQISAHQIQCETANCKVISNNIEFLFTKILTAKL